MKKFLIVLAASSTLLTYSSMFADQFGGAVYNAETKSYALPSVTVGEGSSAQTFSGATIKFADKKIAELSYTAVQSDTAGTSQSVTILYSAYGSTSVTLPANYTDKTQTVSEAEWRAAFSADVFANVSYTMKQGQPDEFYTVAVQRQTVGDTYYVRHVNADSQNSVTYYEITDEAVYSYTPSGDKWIKQKTDSYESDIAPQLVPSLAGDFAEFTYDAASETFRTENLPSAYFTGYTYDLAEVRFSGTDLAYLKIELTPEKNQKYFAEFTFENCGTTVVELPADEDVIDKTQGAEFTEEDWKAAFDRANYGNVTFTRTFTNTGSSGNTLDLVVKVCPANGGTYVYCKDFDNADHPEGTETFTETLADGTSYLYQIDDTDGKWHKTESYYTAPFGLSALEEVLIFAGYYSDFTPLGNNRYGADRIAFPSGSALAEADGVNIVLTFADGVLVAAEMEVEADLGDDAGTASLYVTYALSDFGSTEITLPADHVDDTAPPRSF